jgi:hypothetical protein
VNAAFGVDTLRAVTAQTIGSKYVAGDGALAGSTENEVTAPPVVTVTLTAPGVRGVELTHVPLAPCGRPLVRNEPSTPGTAMLCTAIPDAAPTANPYCFGLADATLTVSEYEFPLPTALHESPETVLTVAVASEAGKSDSVDSPIAARHNRPTFMTCHLP